VFSPENNRKIKKVEGNIVRSPEKVFCDHIEFKSRLFYTEIRKKLKEKTFSIFREAGRDKILIGF
jgi:hypothetical protein